MVFTMLWYIFCARTCLLLDSSSSLLPSSLFSSEACSSDGAAGGCAGIGKGGGAGINKDAARGNAESAELDAGAPENEEGLASLETVTEERSKWKLSRTAITTLEERERECVSRSSCIRTSPEIKIQPHPFQELVEPQYTNTSCKKASSDVTQAVDQTLPHDSIE